MKRLLSIPTLLVSGLLLSLPFVDSSATTCVELSPLKPVNRICGIVFFPNGNRISHAKVTVLQASKKVAMQETAGDGKFSFNHLAAGDYEIRVYVEAIPVAGTKVVLVHPEVKPKREIAVSMIPEGCSTFSLVNPKKFENGLNPSSSSQD